MCPVSNAQCLCLRGEENERMSLSGILSEVTGKLTSVALRVKMTLEGVWVLVTTWKTERSLFLKN